MLRSVVQRFLCRRYAPLLAPYGEGGLSAAARARVAAHLSACPNCRAEFAERQAVAALLRAHVPAPAAPAADLWAKLEARIQAEAPRPLVISDVLPESGRLPATEPRFIWNAFGRSFASAGAVVGVAVACTLVVLQKGLEVFPPQRPAPLAAAPPAAPSPDAVVIALQPKLANVSVPAPEAKKATIQSETPRLAESQNSKFEVRGSDFAAREKPSPLTASLTQNSSTPRPIRLVIRRGTSANAATPRYAVQVANSVAHHAGHKVQVAALGYVQPGEPQETIAATEELVVTDNPTGQDSGTKSWADSVRPEPRGDAPLHFARVPLRQVAWVAGGELESRAVPASASAADALMQERQNQTLFSYTR